MELKYYMNFKDETYDFKNIYKKINKRWISFKKKKNTGHTEDFQT